MAWVPLQASDITWTNLYGPESPEPGVFVCDVGASNNSLWGSWQIEMDARGPRRARIIVDYYTGGMTEPPDREAWVKQRNSVGNIDFDNEATYPESNTTFSWAGHEFEDTLGLSFSPPLVNGRFGPGTASAPLAYQMRVELWEDEPDPEPPPTASCFWTDLRLAKEDCGELPPPGLVDQVLVYAPLAGDPYEGGGLNIAARNLCPSPAFTTGHIYEARLIAIREVFDKEMSDFACGSPPVLPLEEYTYPEEPVLFQYYGGGVHNISAEKLSEFYYVPRTGTPMAVVLEIDQRLVPELPPDIVRAYGVIEVNEVWNDN